VYTKDIREPSAEEMFGPEVKRKVAANWRKLHNQELNDFVLLAIY
jgi:hypothetical protein